MLIKFLIFAGSSPPAVHKRAEDKASLQILSQDALEEELAAHEKFIGGMRGGTRLNLNSRRAEGLIFCARDLKEASFVGAGLGGAKFAQSDLAQANFFGADLSGADLSYVDLVRADLRGVKLKRANLEHSNLQYADLRDGFIMTQDEKGNVKYMSASSGSANFDAARMNRVDLSYAKAPRTFGRGTDLSGAIFDNCILKGANLSNSDLRGSSFFGADLTDANLSGCILHGANLMNCTLENTNFDEADLTASRFLAEDFRCAHVMGAIFPKKLQHLDDYLKRVIERHREWLMSGGASGAQADFEGTDLSGIQLGRLNLAAGNFSLATLSDSELDGAQFSMSDFSGVLAPGAHMMGCDMRGVNMKRSVLQGACLKYSDFSPMPLGNDQTRQWAASFVEADLENADLRKCNLTGADLTQANLKNTDLRGANLRGAILRQTDFSGANCQEAVMTECDMTQALGLQS